MARTTQATELADELLKPLGLNHTKLREDSRRDFMDRMESAVKQGRDNELYDSQKGWKRGE